VQGLPASAAWRHVEARAGVEVVFLAPTGDGLVVHGQSTAVEDGVAWGVRYAIALDATWTTRSARVAGRSAAGPRQVRVEGDGAGGWRVDGRPAPELAGCLDVDLEASAFTNAFPVHRLGLAVGARAEAPAAYVRAPGLQVERLEQRYARLPDDGDLRRYDYAAPAFGFTAQLAYDRHGLVIDYPGIAVRLT
jgi:hypothetical protein